MRRGRQPWEDLRGCHTLLRENVGVVATAALELSSLTASAPAPPGIWSSIPPEVKGMELFQGAKVEQTLTSEGRHMVQREAVAHWEITCCQKACV